MTTEILHNYLSIAPVSLRKEANEASYSNTQNTKHLSSKIIRDFIMRAKHSHTLRFLFLELKYHSLKT